MTAAQSPKIFEVLDKHFHNAEDAKVVVTEIEQIIEAKISDKKDTLATKEDVANNKAEIIKWMFIFWVGQVAATVAIVKLLVH